MPPKGTKKKAKEVVGKTKEDAILDADLVEIDMKVDEWKSQLEGAMDDTIKDMRTIIETAILKLPSKVKNMTMETFMREFSGQTALVLEKERKLNKLARSAVKPDLSARIAATVLKTTARSARVPMALAGRTGDAVADMEASASSSSAAAGDAPPAKMPRLMASSAAGSASLRSTTPAAPRCRAAGSVLDAVAGGGGGRGIAAPTPSSASYIASINPHLPKTPAVRRPRRGEVLYAVSANGSPLGPVTADGGAPTAAAGASSSSSSAAPSSSSSAAAGGRTSVLVKPLAASSGAAAAAPAAASSSAAGGGTAAAGGAAALVQVNADVLSAAASDAEGAAAMLEALEAAKAQIEMLQAQMRAKAAGMAGVPAASGGAATVGAGAR